MRSLRHRTKELVSVVAALSALGVFGACHSTCGGGEESKEDADAPIDATTADAQKSPWPTAEETKVKCPELLVAARKDGTMPNKYVVPSDADRAVMRDAIALLLSKGESARADAAKKLEPIGFVIDDLPEVKNALVVHEQDGKKRGGGAYVIRTDETSKVVVETPHTFYDEGTFQLGFDFFTYTHARVWFLNTVHRYKGAPAGPDGVHPSDVAHSPTSLFQAATEGAITALGAPTVIQLHGFAEREGGGRAVISTGEKAKDQPLLIKMKAALEPAAGAPILRYPDDSKELGATTNVQGSIVRSAKGRFFHMEMSESLRRELLVNEPLRTHTWAALSSGLELK
jgi:hypothetical protein